MDDVRGDFLGPPHGTPPAAVIAKKGISTWLLLRIRYVFNFDNNVHFSLEDLKDLYLSCVSVVVLG